MRKMQVRPYGNRSSHLLLFIYGAAVDVEITNTLTVKRIEMLSAYFANRRRRRTYRWKPAVDLSNPRIAAALSTFSSN